MRNLLSRAPTVGDSLSLISAGAEALDEQQESP
jgi:hypothetical protein